ncbi:Amino acid transporter ANTL3 [Capsicum baccatum]|uniref:Amino acid transporter ANTL3 n=1 Tax=Capsicum baccatum TaxID=33114 RepID=A0A2G2XC75_CAPBA|nr:Amino acid transporter ANTL3 [Capsicum baccatum]
MGTLMLLSVASLTYHCMMLLVYTRQKLESHYKVAKISSLGDLGYVVCGSIGAMGVVMVEDVLIFLKNRSVLEAFGGFSVFFYRLSVSVYAFEGVGMVLQLEAEMKDKDKFGNILGLSMTFISLMYGSFGILGYFAFGERLQY